MSRLTRRYESFKQQKAEEKPLTRAPEGWTEIRTKATGDEIGARTPTRMMGQGWEPPMPLTKAFPSKVQAGVGGLEN